MTIGSAGHVSLLTVLDPDRLAVVAEVSLPAPSMGRVAADRVDGVDLLYVADDEHVFRYRYRAGSFPADAARPPRLPVRRPSHLGRL